MNFLPPGHPLWQDRRVFPDIPLPARSSRAGGRSARVREGHIFKLIKLPPIVVSPVIVSWGKGTDSSAELVLLVAMKERGNLQARPDCIMFADTGSEKPSTNEYSLTAFLLAHGFPEPVYISKHARGTSKHASLGGQCITTKQLPSLAYGGKSCSIKWKISEMDFWTARWEPAQAAWATGQHVHKLIGYDASPADMKRGRNLTEDDQYRNHYPLRDAGLTRPKLIQILDAAGLPQPGKSACFMCPASKKPEINALAEKHPDLCAVSLKMEAGAIKRALSERDELTTVGLGRSFNWREHLTATSRDRLADIVRRFDTGLGDWLDIQKIVGNRSLLVTTKRGKLLPIPDEGDCGAPP